MTELELRVLLLGIATACVYLGFAHARIQRLKAECKAAGHRWLEHTEYYECLNCGQKASIGL